MGIYVTALLWIVMVRFCWEPLSQLIKGYGGLSDVFWIAFGVVTLGTPAVVMTIKILRKRNAMASEAEEIESPAAD